jgi:hypothetical protein
VPRAATAPVTRDSAFTTWRRIAEKGRPVLSEDGRVAEVYEIESDEAGTVIRRLVFSESTRIRRIDSYPADWRTLDGARLLALFADV